MSELSSSSYTAMYYMACCTPEQIMEPQTTAIEKQRETRTRWTVEQKGETPISRSLSSQYQCAYKAHPVCHQLESKMRPPLSFFTLYLLYPSSPRRETRKREQSIKPMIKLLIKHKSEHALRVVPSGHQTMLFYHRLRPSSTMVK